MEANRTANAKSGTQWKGAFEMRYSFLCFFFSFVRISEFLYANLSSMHLRAVYASQKLARPLKSDTVVSAILAKLGKATPCSWVFRYSQTCDSSFLAKFWRALEFVILWSNRWLKIEVTARQESVFPRCHCNLFSKTEDSHQKPSLQLLDSWICSLLTRGRIKHTEVCQLLRQMSPPVGIGRKCPKIVAYKASCISFVFVILQFLERCPQEGNQRYKSAATTICWHTSTYIRINLLVFFSSVFLLLHFFLLPFSDWGTVYPPLPLPRRRVSSSLPL